MSDLSDVGDSSKLKVQTHPNTITTHGWLMGTGTGQGPLREMPSLAPHSALISQAWAVGSQDTHTHSLIHEIMNMAPYDLTPFFSTPPSPLVPAIHSQGSPSLSSEYTARPPKGAADHPHTPHQSLWPPQLSLRTGLKYQIPTSLQLPLYLPLRHPISV